MGVGPSLARPRNVYVNFKTPWDAFRQKLPASPTVAPGSAQVVSTLVTQLAQDQYTNLTMNFMPLVVVPIGQPLVAVSATTSNLPSGEAPVPTYAQTIASNASDGPMCMVRPATGEAWEFWQMTYSSSAWSSTDAGYVSNAHSAAGSFPGSYGLSASGLAYSGIMITEADIKSGVIDHTIGITVAWCTYPPNGTYWPPAVRYDSGDTGGPNGPTEGMLLTWKAGTTKPTGLTPIASMVYDAIANYGMYVMDVTTASNTNPNQGLGIQFEQQSDWSVEGGIGTDPITTAMGGQANYNAIAPLGTIFNQLEVITPPALGSGGSQPSAPTGLTVGTITDTSVALSWTAATNALYYLIEYSSDSGSTWTLAGMEASPATWPTGTSFTVTGLVGGTSYEFRVWTMGANGSGYSGQLSAPTAAVSATTSNAPVFSADTPPDAVVNTSYSYTFVASGSPTFSVASGTIPTGLTLSSAGVLSGVPTSIGSSTFTVTASSTSLGTSTTTSSITINVNSALTVPAVTNADFGYGGTLTPAFPTGWLPGDVCYAFTSLAGSSPANTPTGWTSIAGPDSNQFTTTAVFRRVLQSGDTAPGWVDPGTGSDQFDVGYVLVRNADNTTPEDVTAAHGTTYGGPPTLTINSVTPTTAGCLVLYYLAGYLTSGTVDTNTSQVAYTEGNAHEYVFYDQQAAATSTPSTINSSVNQPVSSYAVIPVKPKPAPTIVQSNLPATSSSSFTTAYTNNVTAGNKLVVIAANGASNGGISITDTANNTWTKDLEVDATNGFVTTFWSAVANASGAVSVTMTAANSTVNFPQVDVFELSNVTGVDVSVSNAATTTSTGTFSSGSVTTRRSGIAFANLSTNGTYTTGTNNSGWTEDTSSAALNDENFAVFHQFVASGQSLELSGTMTAGAADAMVITYY